MGSLPHQVGSPSEVGGRRRKSIRHTLAVIRPDLLEAIAAHTDMPVVEGDGRVAVAGIRRTLSPNPSRLVAAEATSRACSSGARS
jgi:hypothetical protein